MKITPEFLQQRPLSYSSIKTFGISPAHYISYLTEPRKETPALLLGKALHLLILQPELFEQQYAIQPEADGRTKEGKEIKAQFAIESTGKAIITLDVFEQCQKMAKSVDLSEAACELINACSVKETRIPFEFKGLPFVSIVDGMNSDYILELKTTTDASNNAFSRDAYNFKYFLQAGIYCQATGLESMKYIVIEKEPPFAVNIFVADEDYLEAGLNLLNRLTDEFKACMEQGRFNEGYSYWRFSDAESLSLPAWAQKQLS